MAKYNKFASRFLNEQTKNPTATKAQVNKPGPRGYLITSHNKQPSPRPTGKESHHPEWQASMSKVINNYSKGKAPTLLLSKGQHKIITKLQTGQKKANPNHYKEMGTQKHMMQEHKNLRAVGVPEKVAGQTILEADGYAKSTTPLGDVKGAIRKWWADRQKPGWQKANANKNSKRGSKSGGKGTSKAGSKASNQKAQTKGNTPPPPQTKGSRPSAKSGQVAAPPPPPSLTKGSSVPSKGGSTKFSIPSPTLGKGMRPGAPASIKTGAAPTTSKMVCGGIYGGH
jgi:hypothetical protein